MSGLFLTLSNASRALDAQQYGLEIVGQNIANLNTDGYARRRVDFAETRPPDQNSPGGVDILGARAQRDALLESRVRAEVPNEQLEGAIADSLSIVETSLGDAGTSVDARLTAFFDSFSALADDPQSGIARDSVVLQGKQLAVAFNDMASRLRDARAGADTQFRGAVGDINTLATQIASLNVAIASAVGGDTESLKDQQAVALKSLAQLANITVMNRDDGGADVAIGNGRALVFGATAHALGIGSAGISGMATVTSGGTDITAEITSGRIAGLTQVRDTYIPAYQSQLDTLASTVVARVNGIHFAAYGAGGVTGNNFFAPVAGSGSAALMALDPSLTSATVAASQSGAAGDNQAAKDIAALRDAKVIGGTSSCTDAWSHLVYQVGSDTKTAQTNQQVRHDIVTAVQKLRDTASAPSLDEEAANMMKFQRAYEANAKYFNAVDQVLQTLIAMVNG